MARNAVSTRESLIAPRLTSASIRARCSAGASAIVQPGSGQKLEEVGRQVVELSAAGLAAEVVLDSPPEAVVGGLAHERRDLPLWLGADFPVGQPRGDVLGAHDRPGRQIDLVGDLEAVDVVVHRVEERETSVPALEARDLLALEDAPL